MSWEFESVFVCFVFCFHIYGNHTATTLLNEREFYHRVIGKLSNVFTDQVETFTQFKTC